MCENPFPSLMDFWVMLNCSLFLYLLRQMICRGKNKETNTSLLNFSKYVLLFLFYFFELIFQHPSQVIQELLSVNLPVSYLGSTVYFAIELYC